MKRCYYPLAMSFVLLPVLVLVIVVTSCWAGMNSGHKVAVHVLPHEARTCSKNFPAITSCGDIITTYPGCGDIDIFPVFYGLVGVTAIEFGLDWPAEWGTCAFTRCVGLLSNGTIVNSGDGTTISWSACQYQSVVVVGHGWLSASTAGTVCPIPRLGTSTIGTADCNFVVDPARASFCSGVCGVSGEDPCQAVYLPLDLTIDDGLGGSCLTSGATVTYTTSYDNAVNPYDVHGAVLTDYLPEEVEFQSASSGGTYAPGSHSVSWSLGTIAAGASGSVEVHTQAQTGLTPESYVTNTCDLTSAEAPNSECSISTIVCPDDFQPLNISKKDGRAENCALADKDINYVIQFGNEDNSAQVHNVVLVDHLPPEVIFRDATAPRTYDPENHSITWTFDNLPAGASRSVEALVKVRPETTRGSTIVNLCEIWSDETPASQYTCETVICMDATPLLLSKGDDVVGCVARGQSITHTITYSNPTGNPIAHNAEVRDVLSPKTLFVSASDGGLYDPDFHRVVWTIGDLLPGEQDSMEVIVEVGGAQTGWVKNIGRIISDDVMGKNVENEVVICDSGITNPYHKIAIHVMAHEERTCTSGFPVIDECSDIDFSHPGCGDIDAFPVFYDLQGIEAGAFGMTWPEEWGTCSFTICEGDHSAGELVNPGDGIQLFWDTCQQRTLITMGYGWLVADSPGRICIVPEPLAGMAGVVGCNADMEAASATFCAGVCGEAGDNPCGTVHTVPTTWGRIKAMFR